MHVLIIEDEVLLAMNMQYFFEELGADSVGLAQSEGEAVRQALDHRPDLIASDVCLSPGSGPAAVKAIRSHLGDVPVIYVTGNAADAAADDPGAIVLEKPILWLDLVKATSQFGLPPTQDESTASDQGSANT